MTNILHTSSQETSSGNGISSPEPALLAQNFIVVITQLSLNLLGSVSFKVQHSPDGENWIDVPNLSTGNLSATGATTISLSPSFAVLDYQRVAWTCNNANSVTFTAYLTGAK